MKISKKIGILIVIAAIVAILLFSMLGIEIRPFLYFLYFGLLIAIGYIIIDGIGKFANKLVDALAKRQAVSNEEINTKIEFLMQKMQIIENKVDKINAILEKVSE